MTPKHTEKESADRLPPGQYLVRDFPVLHVGDVPKFDPATWRLRVFGAVERPLELTWDEFKGLPTRIVKTDIHCVTRWTKFDTTWEGVPFAEIAKRAGPKPTATSVITHAANGYTANVPFAVATREDVLLAHTYDGKPLEPIHGGPMRMFVPSLYFWKSTKWCSGIEFRDNDEPGFWEVRGYNNNADPWKEERYW